MAANGNGGHGGDSEGDTGAVDTRAVDSARYVRLTTFRRDGRAVTCPVWVVRVGATHGFTTDLDSGKVKRLRHDQRVEVSVSDVRGRVAAGATVYAGKGRVVAGAEADAIHAAVVRKYRVLGRLLAVGGELVRRVRRRPPEARCAVELRLTATR